jgi:4-aminobutyrate aminotransferase
MFAFEHFDYRPDIVTLAKGIASGMPLGLTLAQASVMNWGPGAHASTFGGNPLSLAAARETVSLLKERYLANTQKMGALLRDGLEDLRARHAGIGEVRGLGLMLGIEFVSDPKAQTPDPETRNRVVEAAFRKGLLILGAGTSTVRLSPPLVVDEEQCRFALRTLDQAIAEATA